MNKKYDKYDSSPRHLISIFWKVMVMSNQDFYEIIMIEQNQVFLYSIIKKFDSVILVNTLILRHS